MPEQEVVTGAQAPAAPPQAPAAAPAQAEGQNQTGEAPAADPEGKKPDTDQDPEKQRGTRRFERRLDKAYRRAAEAEARAQLFETQLKEARAQSQPPADPSAPRLEQFDDVEKYAAAKAKYESEKVLREHSAKQQTESTKRHQAQLIESYEAKAARAEGKYEDYDDVVGDISPETPMGMAIMEADNAEDVAWFLGKNIKEAERIAKLPPLSQIREIGKIEAKLLADPPVKPKTPSKAPAPITPLKGAAPVTTDVPSEQDDMKTWFRKRQKQVHGKR
jgi:hypothetical protein